MIDEAAFLSHFHNLPGETIKEKQQNLFKLFRENHWLKNDVTKLNFVTKNLQTKTHLEKIFRADFLIYFKRVEELYKDFKTGDEIAIKKLAKHHWFYQKVFKDVSCEDFINGILPSSSYSLKTTILKRIPLEEAQADIFFDAVLAHYGLPLATILLPKCSSQKIRETIKTHPVNLTVAQLQAIFDKDPVLISVYLEEKTDQNGDSKFINNNPILVYIAQKNPQLFSELFKEHRFKVGLGRRTTKRYIDAQKWKILAEKVDYIKILNEGATVRKLGAEMSDVFFETKDESVEMYWKSMLKYYPKNRQFDIYKASYNKLYHFKIGEKIEDIFEEELKIMSDPQERQELALRKKDQEEDNKYLRYVTPEYCLKELMVAINYASSSERCKYIENAAYCGFLNKDLELLHKVCELIAVRFKNDDDDMRWRFTLVLAENKDNLKIFEERHWNLIHDIIATSKAKRGYLYEQDLLAAHHLKYLVKNHKSLKTAVQDICHVDNVVDHIDPKKDAETFRMMLTELLEQGYQEMDDTDDPEDKEYNAASYYCILLGHCRTYNEKNPKTAIDVLNNPTVLTSVRHLLESDRDDYLVSSLHRGLEYFLCRKSTELEPLKALYFAKFKTYGRMSSLFWFAKNEPSVLSRYFDHFLNSFVDTRGINTRKFWKYVKKCSHLDLDKRTVDFCRLKLTEEEYGNKVHVIRPLSILTPTPSHLEFIKQYKPLSDKVDLTDDDSKALYAIQEKIVRFLHYSGASKEVLEATFDFCKGDYLKFALSPLYCCFYKLPENDTKEHLQKLESVKALSVKKHATFLSCVIYGQNQVRKCLANSGVPTLLATMKYFAKTPSDDLWSLVETKLQGLDKKELLLLKEVLKIHLPSHYKSKFVEAMWRLLDKHQNKELRNLLIEKVDKLTVRNLRPEFALKTIKDCIFRYKKANRVIAIILIFGEAPGKFSLLSKILSRLKETSKQPKLRGLARHNLTSFIQTVFITYMENEEVKEKFVSEITSVFTSTFSLIDAFEEVVAVRFMAWKDKIDDCAKGLIGLNRVICEAFGSYAVHLLVKTLNTFILKHAFYENDDRTKLCHSLFKFKDSNNDWLLILGLLPEKAPLREEPFVLYQEVLTAMEQVTDDLVQLQMGSFLMNGPHNESDWDFSCDTL